MTKLLQRLHDELVRRNYAETTIRTYLHAASRLSAEIGVYRLLGDSVFKGLSAGTTRESLENRRLGFQDPAIDRSAISPARDFPNLRVSRRSSRPISGHVSSQV